MGGWRQWLVPNPTLDTDTNMFAPIPILLNINQPPLIFDTLHPHSQLNTEDIFIVTVSSTSRINIMYLFPLSQYCI